MRCSTQAPDGSATTSAAPGTRRGRGRSSETKSTEPAVGESGREEHVPELRVETVVPAHLLEDVVAALRRAHPYEEPAYDVYALVDA